MRKPFVAVVPVIVFVAASCTPKTSGGQQSPASGDSKLASVSIGAVASLKDQLGKTLQETDSAKKKHVMDSLVYQLKIHPVANSCDQGVTGTEFDSELVSISTASFDKQSVNKGCDYTVVMIIGTKESSVKLATTYFESNSSKSNLPKTELIKAAPVASVDLLVTSDGVKLWPDKPIPVPHDP